MCYCTIFTASRNLFPAQFSFLLRSGCKVHGCDTHIPNGAVPQTHCNGQRARKRPASSRLGSHRDPNAPKIGTALGSRCRTEPHPNYLKKHFLMVFSWDPGRALRGTVHLLKVTPALKKKRVKEGKKKITTEQILHCWKQLHLLPQFYFEQHNASNRKGHNKKCSTCQGNISLGWNILLHSQQNCLSAEHFAS